jgi:hypothetical protein
VGSFLKKRSLAFTEPINLYEQFEERIVLDASIANPGDQTINKDATLAENNDVSKVNQHELTLTVNNKLDFTSDPLETVVEDDQLLFHVQTKRETIGDHMRYTLEGAVPAWVSIGETTGVLSGNPNYSDVNPLGFPYQFTIRAENLDTTDQDTQAFTLTVSNDPSEFLNVLKYIFMTKSSGVQTFDVLNNDETAGLTKYSFSQVNTNDLGWDLCTYPVIADWIFIGADAVLLTANPKNYYVGTHNFTIWVTDQPGNWVTLNFTLTVTKVAPTWEAPPAAFTLTLTEDTTGNHFDFLANNELQNYPYAAGGARTQEITPSISIIQPIPRRRRRAYSTSLPEQSSTPSLVLKAVTACSLQIPPPLT